MTGNRRERRGRSAAPFFAVRQGGTNSSHRERKGKSSMESNEAPSPDEVVAQYLVDQDKPRQVGQIAKATGLEWTATRKALQELENAGRASSSGKGIAQKWALTCRDERTAALADNNDGPQDDAATAADDEGAVEQVEDLPTSAESAPVADETDESAAAESNTAEPPLMESETEPAAAKAVPLPIPAPEIGYVWLVLGEADGVTVDYLHERTGYSHGVALKALWALRDAGLVVSTGPFLPDRGKWSRLHGADEAGVAFASLATVPAKVACIACGHVQALAYKPRQAKAVSLWEPDEPVPVELSERDEPQREPVVMFCAEVLSRAEATAAELAARTGHAEPVVLRALWALRRHHLVSCTEPRSVDGGIWMAERGLGHRSAFVALKDAPAAIGCAECGRSVSLRGSASGNSSKGVSRANTVDGGTSLPNGSLNSMVKAWAMDSRDLNESSRTVTPTQLHDLLCRAAESGDLAVWLTAWARAFPSDKDAVRVPRVLAALDSGDRPRSSGAVVNALRRLSLEADPPVALVGDIAAETYRAVLGYGTSGVETE
jgi:hypothetical protein